MLSYLLCRRRKEKKEKKDTDTVRLNDLPLPAYLMDTGFQAVRWNLKVCELYPKLIPTTTSPLHPIPCPCIELLTIAQGGHILQCMSERRAWSVVVQERVLSVPAWSPSSNPELMDETFTKLRCKAEVHTRMLYDLEVAGGVLRSFELTFAPIAEGSALILVLQDDITFRVMQNYALFRLIDLNMGLLAQIYPIRFIHDILGAGERRNSLSFSPDDCKKYCEHHDNVVILFADIVGFTRMCKGMKPLEIMDLLTLLYESNDKTLKQFPSLSKLEVVGDCYVAVGGLTLGNGATENLDLAATASQMLDFALALQDIASAIERPPDCLTLRIGIHCGPVTSGIIGRTSCKFMLFGDAMNTASRMESTCPSGEIQTSQQFHDLVTLRTGWTRTDGVVVKGKGEMVTFIYEAHLKKPLRCDGSVRASHRSLGQLDLPINLDSLEQDRYTSRASSVQKHEFH